MKKKIRKSLIKNPAARAIMRSLILRSNIRPNETVTSNSISQDDSLLQLLANCGWIIRTTNGITRQLQVTEEGKKAFPQ